MAAVQIRPGDTLNIVWTSVQETPLGVREVESNFSFSYDELLTRLKTKGRAGKSRRSGTLGAKFSRMVALSHNALKKGKWSTGADIDRDHVFAKLMERFRKLDDTEFQFITDHAREALLEIYNSKIMIKPPQKKELQSFLTQAKILSESNL